MDVLKTRKKKLHGDEILNDILRENSPNLSEVSSKSELGFFKEGFTQEGRKVL